jgi:hypothetical protein
VPYFKNMLDQVLGGWQMISGKSNRFSPINLMKILIKYGYQGFTNINIASDPKNTQKYVIKVLI